MTTPGTQRTDGDGAGGAYGPVRVYFRRSSTGLPLQRRFGSVCRVGYAGRAYLRDLSRFAGLPGGRPTSEALLRGGNPFCRFPPQCWERAVFRSKELPVGLDRELAGSDPWAWIIPAHYTAPVTCTAKIL